MYINYVPAHVMYRHCTHVPLHELLMNNAICMARFLQVYLLIILQMEATALCTHVWIFVLHACDILLL